MSWKMGCGPSGLTSKSPSGVSVCTPRGRAWGSAADSGIGVGVGAGVGAGVGTGSSTSKPKSRSMLNGGLGDAIRRKECGVKKEPREMANVEASKTIARDLCDVFRLQRSQPNGIVAERGRRKKRKEKKELKIRRCQCQLLFGIPFGIRPAYRESVMYTGGFVQKRFLRLLVATPLGDSKFQCYVSSSSSSSSLSRRDSMLHTSLSTQLGSNRKCSVGHVFFRCAFHSLIKSRMTGRI